jgi:hypothetical protein
MLTPSVGWNLLAASAVLQIVRIVATVAALLMVAGAQASTPNARPLTGLKAPDGPLLGMVWVGEKAEIAPLDAATLEPAGKALPVKNIGAWTFSPSHDQLALGSTRSPLVRFVDAARLQPLRSVKLGLSGTVERIDWLSARSVVVVYAHFDGTRIAWVDPTTGKVVKRGRLGMDPFKAASGGGRLVALLPPRKGIGTARLAVVGTGTRARIVSLPKIRIGSTVPRENTVFRRISPGLALDPDGAHAYVVGTEGVVADVNLRSRAVAYHSLTQPRSLAARLGAWLVPTAEAKQIAGPVLDATWLGGGLVAVAGTRYDATTGKDGETQFATPLGLRVVDVRTWTQRTLDAGANGFAIADDALLAYGVRSQWSQTAQSVSGMGVAAYGTDGNARFHLLPSVPVGYVQVNGSRAYGWVDDQANAWHIVVLDVAAGTVERDLTLTHPTHLLIGDGSY